MGKQNEASSVFNQSGQKVEKQTNIAGGNNQKIIIGSEPFAQDILDQAFKIIEHSNLTNSEKKIAMKETQNLAKELSNKKSNKEIINNLIISLLKLIPEIAPVLIKFTTDSSLGTQSTVLKLIESIINKP